MRKTTLSPAMLAISLLLISISIPLITSGPVKGDPQTRGPILIIENEVKRFDASTGSAEFSLIEMGPNSRLEVIGVTIKAGKLYSDGPQENSSVIVEGTDDTRAMLVLREGEVNLEVGEVRLNRSIITVGHGSKQTLEGEDGLSSSFKVATLGGGVEMRDSDLKVNAMDGGNGGYSLFAGNGGNVQVSISDLQEGDISVAGMSLFTMGGHGGDAFKSGSGAGTGGSSEIVISGDLVDISGSYILGIGGDGGSHDETNPGEESGYSLVDIRSVHGIDLYSSSIESRSGISTDNNPPPTSILRLRSTDGSVDWDRDKPCNESRQTLSRVVSPVFQIFAGKGAELHQVDCGDEPPYPLDNTPIRLYWWVDITVVDSYNNPVPGAYVYYMIEGDPIPQPPDLLRTNANGSTSIEVVVRSGADWNRFRFFAQLGQTGQPEGTDSFRLDSNSNRAIHLMLELLSVEISTQMEGLVENDFVLEGTAVSRMEDEIDSIKMYFDDAICGIAKDLSSIQGGPPFSSWSINMDQSIILPGVHKISLLVSCGGHETVIVWIVEIQPFSLNNRPLMDSVNLRYQTYSFDLDRDLEFPVHVSPYYPVFDLTVRVFEPDFGSEVLEDPDGRVLDSIGIEIYSLEDKREVFGYIFEVSRSSPDGFYSMLFNVDTSRTEGSYDPWPPGQYVLEAIARDTGGKQTLPWKRNLLLYVDQPPLIKVKAGKDDPIDPTPDAVYPGTSFSFEVPSDRELKVYFLLRGCRDIDDENYFPDPGLDRSWQNLTYTVYIQPLGGERVLVFGPWKGAEGFFHTFDLSNYTERDTPVFELILEVTDMDGLTTEGSYAVNIEIGPPKDGPPPLVPLWAVIGLGVFWAAAIAAAFGLVLPAYNRRKRDKIRRIMKDPRLKEFAMDAMKGEKPSHFRVSNRELKKGLDEHLEKGNIDTDTYQSIINDLSLGHEKQKINSD
ncbi:MAG: hypothetical protein ACMUHB_03605 [Thermoplasmatota archaeon]